MKRKEFTEKQEKEICRLYQENLMNPIHIGKRFDCSITPIYKILKKYAVDTTSSNRHKLLYSSGKRKAIKGKDHYLYGKKPYNLIIFNKTQTKKIIDLYETDLMNAINIGKEFNCDGDVIRRILKENNVDMGMSNRHKKLYKAGKLIPHNKGKPFLAGEKNPMYGKVHPNKGKKGLWKMSEESKEKMILAKKNMSDETKQKMSQNMKERIKRGDKNLKLFGHGINPSFPLEKNPAWLGGKSFEPYDSKFNEKFKRAIRKRDNQVCMMCGIHREKMKIALSVHHIDYDKLNSFPQNCIALCNSCHMTTNTNRKQWIPFFQAILSKNYGYKYEDNKPIIEII